MCMIVQSQLSSAPEKVSHRGPNVSLSSFITVSEATQKQNLAESVLVDIKDPQDT